jgi:hypothetical protein
MGVEGILTPSPADAGRTHIALTTAAMSGNFAIPTSSFADTTTHVNNKAACLFVWCTRIT